MNNQNEGYEYDEMTGEVVSEVTAIAVPNNEAVVNVNRVPQLIAPDQIPDLDAMEQGFSLQAKYIEFEQVGTCERGVFLGFTQMINQQGNRTDVANFQNKRGVWVNAGANLVSQLRNVPEGTPLAVTYRGKEETKRGMRVKLFEVRILNATKSSAPSPELPKEAQASIDAATASKVNIPSAQGNGANVTGAKKSTARAQIKTKLVFEKLIPYAVERGYVANDNDAVYHVTAVAAKFGHTEITDANFDTVLASIDDYYQAKQAVAESEQAEHAAA